MRLEVILAAVSMALTIGYRCGMACSDRHVGDADPQASCEVINVAGK